MGRQSCIIKDHQADKENNRDAGRLHIKRLLEHYSLWPRKSKYIYLSRVFEGYNKLVEIFLYSEQHTVSFE